MEEPEKSRYHAERLVGSAIVQEFHVMVQEGLEYSYLTNGLMDVQLWVRYDDPATFYYHLGDPVELSLDLDLDLDDANSESASPEQSTSEYLTSSSPILSGPRVTT
ncbi:hypothetical protein N8T08_009328 [Aspergillus melleus]|uniref:Uncharacterized protein n=1 Tax=Aspergillus melleus TaxID=138277 RepID=A0ACC3AU01_9EURO|nr:hypothetical protein N8T08_009328 [Aspergillus melleus]